MRYTIFIYILYITIIFCLVSFSLNHIYSNEIFDSDRIELNYSNKVHNKKSKSSKNENLMDIFFIPSIHYFFNSNFSLGTILSLILYNDATKTNNLNINSIFNSQISIILTPRFYINTKIPIFIASYAGMLIDKDNNNTNYSNTRNIDKISKMNKAIIGLGFGFKYPFTNRILFNSELRILYSLIDNNSFNYNNNVMEIDNRLNKFSIIFSVSYMI